MVHMQKIQKWIKYGIKKIIVIVDINDVLKEKIRWN